MTPVPPTSHPAQAHWATLTGQIAQRLRERAVDPSRALVLVPYAQLMAVGRRAWAQAHPSGFSPRFESTRNWAASLQAFLPSANDLSGDMARDSLVAASLVDRVARGRLEASLRPVLIARLVEAARQLGPIAAAQAPAERADWAETRRLSLDLGGGALHWEALVASLALAWVGASAYATDVLWSPMAAPGVAFDDMVVLQGLQPDPLTAALAACWGERVTTLSLQVATPASAPVRLHACGDAHDEAQRAAACVIAHANAGRRPVALVASDRLLVRQISAQLHGAGLVVRDETGWKLSTTHAAARVMSLLRAAHPLARSDDVLDFLQQAQAWSAPQRDALERRIRAQGLALAATALAHPEVGPHVPDGLIGLIADLQAPRPLNQWLADLGQALQRCGWWEALNADAAGQQLVLALRLGEGAAQELAALESALHDDSGDATRRRSARLSLAAFTAWVRDALEGASFMAPAAGAPDVVILPMAQLLGRSFAATVAPGCDDVHLPASPEPPGAWTPLQRQALGLPSREELAGLAKLAWDTLIRWPELDVLWRTQDQGEALMPSPWVVALQAAVSPAAVRADDPRGRQTLPAQVTPAPQAQAGDLLPDALSASAYQDLRDCPYRFFALRQLRLKDSDELESEPDKRDMGIWLHAVLKAFHEARAAQTDEPSPQADRAALDRLAEQVAQTMGLSVAPPGAPAGSGQAGFLPFLAVWPALRDGYLAWLAGFEGTSRRAGPRFGQAELSLSRQVGPYRLVGQLDRLDHQTSPEGAIPLVIDYKTEPRETTRNRVKNPLEDTQIGFYAALLPDDTLRAAYLSISESRSEKDPTLLVEQPEVIALRDHLRQGLQNDLDRVAAGHPMPALGEGRSCDFCAARGLCRRDFWSPA